MATSARELFSLAREHARRVEQPTPGQAEAAVAAVGYAAGALPHLIDDETKGGDPDGPWTTVAQLVAASRAVKATWPPPRPGRLPDLLGAACDLLGTHGASLVEPERWAVAVEVSRATRHCLQLAMRHAAYQRVPALRWAHAAAVEVERAAARHPPAPGSGILLDLPVSTPGAGCAMSATSIRSAAAGLVHALRAECAAGPLPIVAALGTVAAAEQAARSCAELAASNDPAGADAWQQAPSSWQVAHAALARFRDGNRRAGGEPCPTVEAALGLQQALHRSGSREGTSTAEDAAGVRALANTLPLLARQLNLAAHSWARKQTLYACARDLLHTDDLVPAILTNSVVPATAEHLVPVVATIRVAERLSAALADELNRMGAPRGHQPMPATTRVPATRNRQLQIDALRVARLSRRVSQIDGPSRLAL